MKIAEIAIATAVQNLASEVGPELAGVKGPIVTLESDAFLCREGSVMNLEPSSEPSPAAHARRALRARLKTERSAFVDSPAAAEQGSLLASALREALLPLEPQCLGLYCALPSEFNAAPVIVADARFDKCVLALPYARRTPRSMAFRRWDRVEPTLADECGIASCEGALVVPDVVVVPCVGYTAAGYRLGFGGGYYDRWLAAHTHVVAVGVAWSFAEIDSATFAAEPHDIALAFIVTERGVIAG